MTLSKLFKRAIKLLIVTMFLFITMNGCSDNNDDSSTDLIGDWIELSDFEGVPRSNAVSFTIGNKAYVGTGYDGEDRLNDFWEYDPDLNNWTRKADFPGTPRNGAVGFGTDTKGYIGTGYDGDNKLADFYEYDPSANTWKKIADFGGSARYGAVAFAIDNKGYVSTGFDGNALKDLWEYDPSTNEWTPKLSLIGGKRRDAVAFVINGKGYICTGIDNGSYENDLLEYDPATNTWEKKRHISDVSSDDYDDDYTSIVGTYKVAFTINGKGYVATGGKSATGTAVWEYNPETDLWTAKTGLEASARMEATGFAIGDLGYIVTGRNGRYYYDDLWGFKPGSEQVDLNKNLILGMLDDQSTLLRIKG